jgi:hypothetical protein
VVTSFGSVLTTGVLLGETAFCLQDPDRVSGVVGRTAFVVDASKLNIGVASDKHVPESDSSCAASSSSLFAIIRSQKGVNEVFVTG